MLSATLSTTTICERRARGLTSHTPPHDKEYCTGRASTIYIQGLGERRSGGTGQSRRKDARSHCRLALLP